MATYYVDPAATGNDDGTIWTDAWTTLQKAIDGTGGTQPGAGDLVLCRGTENVSAVTDSDGTAGNTTSGKVVYRGVNASGVNDGTRYVMNAGGNAIDILRLSSDYICFENFQIHNTSKASGQNGIIINSYEGLLHNDLINCKIYDCYDGINAGISGVFTMSLIKTQIYNNANDGLRAPSIRQLLVWGGSIHDNGGQNIDIPTSSRGVFISGCPIYDATSNGIDIQGGELTVIHNCVIHGNSDGVEFDDEQLYIIGSRFTSNTVGIDSDALCGLIGCYMPDTGQDLANTTKTAGNISEITIDGTNTNNLSGTDTDGGYEDSSTDDYNLTDSATLRRQEIDLET